MSRPTDAEARLAAGATLLQAYTAFIYEGPLRHGSFSERDRETKRRAYAEVGIPLYLLVDLEEHRVTLFSAPAGDDYTHGIMVSFGEKLDLPQPFGFTLDTAPFAN